MVNMVGVVSAEGVIWEVGAMAGGKARTFEEKINAVLRYSEYLGSWEKARFLPKFAYLADEELEALLWLGREIEAHASTVAGGLFWFGEVLTAEDQWKLERLRAAIRERYPYLDAIRVERLAARAAFYAVA